MNAETERTLTIPASEGTHAILQALDGMSKHAHGEARRVLERISLTMLSDRILTDFGATQAFVFTIVPHFWLSSRLDGETASVSLGPDYNGPMGNRLEKIWPVDLCHAGWTVEIRRIGQPATTRDRCLAMILGMIKAVRASSAYATVLAPPAEPAPVDRLDDLRQVYERILDPDYDTTRLSRRIERLALGETTDRADYFQDIQAVDNLVRKALPGAWASSALCFLSGDGTIGFDAPPPGMQSRYAEDIRPGEGAGNATTLEQCMGLLRCLVAALIDQEIARRAVPDGEAASVEAALDQAVA